MDIESFWKLIEKSKRGSEDCEEQTEKLGDYLAELPAEDIISFDQHFHDRLNAAHTWGLWGVAYLANGGCSDDGFEYFRAWLIAQGRKRFEAALADPESVARYAEPDECECECEDILYVAAEAYEKRAGSAFPESEFPTSLEPTGTRWEEKDLPRLFPKAAKKFLD